PPPAPLPPPRAKKSIENLSCVSASLFACRPCRPQLFIWVRSSSPDGPFGRRLSFCGCVVDEGGDGRVCRPVEEGGEGWGGSLPVHNAHHPVPPFFFFVFFARIGLGSGRGLPRGRPRGRALFLRAFRSVQVSFSPA
ncbi:unnamed protein product, partial [Ixodes pacificus]